MKILGIDPGTSKAGFGLVEQAAPMVIGGRTEHRPGRIYLVASGDIASRSDTPISKRLKEIFVKVQGLIEEYRPDAIAVESSFLHKNVQTAIKLGQARGAVLIAAEISSIPVFEYTPREIKLALVGYGAAEKEQTQWMVKKILGEDMVPDSNHASDALAVAICHIHSAKIRGLIQAGLR